MATGGLDNNVFIYNPEDPRKKALSIKCKYYNWKRSLASYPIAQGNLHNGYSIVILETLQCDTLKCSHSTKFWQVKPIRKRKMNVKLLCCYRKDLTFEPKKLVKTFVGRLR